MTQSASRHGRRNQEAPTGLSSKAPRRVVQKPRAFPKTPEPNPLLTQCSQNPPRVFQRKAPPNPRPHDPWTRQTPPTPHFSRPPQGPTNPRASPLGNIPVTHRTLLRATGLARGARRAFRQRERHGPAGTPSSARAPQSIGVHGALRRNETRRSDPPDRRHHLSISRTRSRISPARPAGETGPPSRDT
jgi:hypothetical protein